MYKSLKEKIKKLEKGSRQRRMKFNPETDVPAQERQEVEDWVRQGGNQEVYGEKDREAVPKMHPNAKTRALDKISKYTESKLHPETGERMFLLHRGVSNEENDKIKAGGHSGTMSSWSPDFLNAKMYANKYNDYKNEVEAGKNIVSAWIPESQIQHIPNAIGSVADQEEGDVDSGEFIEGKGRVNQTDKRKGKVGKVKSYFKPEEEVIVKPHAFELYDNEELKMKHWANEDYDPDFIDEDLMQPIKPEDDVYNPNEKINLRAKNLPPALPADVKRKKDVTEHLGLPSVGSIPKLAASEKQITHEKAKDMLKELVMRKYEEFQHVNPEILEKNIARAFKNGISLLGLITGAHYINPPDKVEQPQAIERSIASEQQAAPREASSNTSFRENQVKNFLQAISMNESSGGKNLDHETMDYGIHKGDAAIGKYGLMPNTVKEMATRMGRRHPLGRYAKMSSDEISASIKKNPQHEEEIANYLANHLYDKHGGNGPRMAYSWNQGHNLSSKHFETTHKNYKDHDYTQKYIKHRQQLEKNPYVADSPEQ